MKEKETKEKPNRIKIVITIIFMVFFIVLVTNMTRILKKPTNVFVVENGSLSFEELAEGYIIRDEVVLQGENYKNGMVRVISDGERAAKSEAVFRYYSSSEDTILDQIAKLDDEISEITENSGTPLTSDRDINSLEKQIETTIDSMYNLNYLQEINENKNEIEAYISKKAQMTATLNPTDSYLKTLIEQRNALENQIEAGSEIMYAPVAGIASYRVDGLETILVTNNFDYLSSDLLNGFNLKVGAIVPLSSEKGKIVNNFECYIATPISTEKAMVAKVGDTVTLRLSNANEIDAEIVYIKEENNSRIIVFKISQDVKELLDYRKISFDIIWWNYDGWKISNACIIEENDKTYVERNKTSYIEKIPIKVLRQNETYSIVENYTDEELKELGYTDEEIENFEKIRLYDEIILH